MGPPHRVADKPNARLNDAVRRLRLLLSGYALGDVSKVRFVIIVIIITLIIIII